TSRRLTQVLRAPNRGLTAAGDVLLDSSFPTGGHPMRTRLFLVTALAALLGASAALAGNGNGHANMRYSFLGQLTATPANGGVSITVEGGNKAALRAMLGQPVTQTFVYGTSTEFLKWADGIPAIVQAGDLSTGDFVW